MEYVTIHPNDTVKVCLQDGHKYARRAIRKGQPVIKYGFPIGTAKADIPSVPGSIRRTSKVNSVIYFTIPMNWKS